MNRIITNKEQIKYIYGAGIVATGVYRALRSLHNIIPEAFIVSSLRGNPSEIDGFPVLQLDKMETSNRKKSIVVATPEMYHDEVKRDLLTAGFGSEQIICVNQQMENQFMEEYLRSLKDLQTVDEWLGQNETCTGKTVYGSIETLKSICLLQAKSHVDKLLQTNEIMPTYVTSIQVGAVLTDRQICKLRDDVGAHISGKNRNYCELTATYYAWKNVHADYKGICHYRRVWDITDTKMQQLMASNADVILPYPSIHFPNIRSQHSRYISEADWAVLLMALQEAAPEYYAAFDSVYRGSFFYNFNMLIAKQEIFDNYCDFMFRVLERVEELTEPKGWERSDRFAGYMGENLTTLYFRKNADKYNIIHTGKKWLV